ncbi:hypothetical protein [Alsobacter sp. SYSU BS001988]|jgi:hypothetical protein
MTERPTDFLPSPLDLGVLKIILATMEQGAIDPDLRYMLVELQIMIEEAERSSRGEIWEQKIRERWRAVEENVRAGRANAADMR